MAKSPLIPFGLLPVGLVPGWLLPGSGGYRVYRGQGATAAAIDFDNPVGIAQAGDAAAYVHGAALAANVEYCYALRAVSDAGVEEDGAACLCRVMIDGDGALVSERPNRLVEASRRATAAGTVTVAFTYSRLGERAAAASVQIARLTNGVADWETPVATVSLSAGRVTRHDAALDDAFDDGDQVRLALRAVTSGGVAGPVTRLAGITADATGPADVERLYGSAAS